MKKFNQIESRRLTRVEWAALQAALPFRRGGLPLVPGLLDELSAMDLNYYDLFVLRGSYTRQLGATYYVLLGFGDDDDIVSEPSEPFIFGIYTDDHTGDCLPDFEEVLRHGFDTLRGYALHDAFLFSAMLLIGGLVIIWVMDSGLIGLGIAVLGSIVGGLIAYLLGARKLRHSKPSPTPSGW